MRVLGIGSDIWISSAALIEDGEVIAAAPEERLNRIKRYRGFPRNAIEFCLSKASCTLRDIDYVAIAWNPGGHIKAFNRRFAETTRWRAEELYAVPNNLMRFFNNERIISIEQELKLEDARCRIVFIDHHLAHAANAFFLSPFEEAAILTIDGRGEDETGIHAIGKGKTITKLVAILFPHSVGLLYSAFTQFLGFTPDRDEWKVMALASYADWNNPYLEKLKKLITVLPNGLVETDLSYFDYYLHDQYNLYGTKVVDEFGPPRTTGDPLTERDYQVAAALQRTTQDVLAQLLNHLQRQTGLENIAVSGGSFMNSVYNGMILSTTTFKDVFISSCPDDSGTSIGAALFVYNDKAKSPKKVAQKHNYYGPEFTNEEIEQTLIKYNIKYQYVSHIERFTATLIAEGKLLGWFQGRMEFGQRALGNRSILCDPRDGSMKNKMNLAVKYREWFRPFAPSILEEEREEYFDVESNVLVPFMEKVYMIKKDKQKLIPAVTHADGTGRLHTVNKETNPRFYEVIAEFRKITGVPVVLNTSFNLNGEAIVCTPTDAIKTFFSCGLDVLVLGNYVITK